MSAKRSWINGASSSFVSMSPNFARINSMYCPSQSVVVEGSLQLFLLSQWDQRLRQTTEIPQTDEGLLVEGIAAVVVGVITDEAGIVVVDEPERTVVERDAVDRHVVGVHDSMCPADSLPLRDQPRRAFDDL